MISAERVRELLHYDPETGIFRWRVAPENNRVRVGAIANKKSVARYQRITVDSIRYRAHRLAWLYVTGAWPTTQIDHINLDKNDNRFANLREATKSQNMANRPAQANNTSGYKGVSWDGKAKKWTARIKDKKVYRMLGRFDNAEDASMAYASAAAKIFGKFARAA